MSHYSSIKAKAKANNKDLKDFDEKKRITIS